MDAKERMLLSDSDLELFLPLLEDFADKLLCRAASWYRLRGFFVMSLVMGSAGTVVALLVATHFYPARGSLGFGGAIAVAISFLVTTMAASFQILRRSRLDSEYIGRLWPVVEGLVRRCSQLNEHGSATVSQKIAYDLRLTEAEAALSLSQPPGRASTNGRHQEPYDVLSPFRVVRLQEKHEG